MLFRANILAGVATGEIRLAFRRWRRPTVKAGGRLRTGVGELAIESVDPVDPVSIGAAEAALAGHASLAALRRELDARPEGTVYRIAFRLARPDPHIALRGDAHPDAATVDDIRRRLDRLDRASRHGPWTRAVLELVAAHPARRASDLAAMHGMETAPFKRDVRKLKELGLTESLDVGYRLSPRGRATLAALAGAVLGDDTPWPRA